MTEYWVSQAKYFCPVCKVYLADNKASRQHHENGSKHKQKVEEQQKLKKAEKLHGARSENELKQQLEEINKAAREAVAIDKAQYGSDFFQNTNIRAAIPAPPPPKPPSFKLPVQFRKDNSNGDDVNEEDGLYCVDGKYYLEGKFHENKIKTGLKCELFLEDLDEWFPGEITARLETHVPHTVVTLKTFDITYQIPQENGTISDYKEDKTDVAVELKVEKGVKNDRIRLFANADGTLIDNTRLKPIAPIINDNTGIGMWQVVSVREIDEEQELLDEMNRQAAENAAKESQKIKPTNDNDDSALSAYNPFHTSKYKGIEIIPDNIGYKNAEMESITNGVTVTFKKRKSNTNNSSKEPENNDNEESNGVRRYRRKETS
eukprot:gene7581-10329_t